MRFLRGKRCKSVKFFAPAAVKNYTFSHYDVIEFWRILTPGSVPPLFSGRSGRKGGQMRVYPLILFLVLLGRRRRKILRFFLELYEHGYSDGWNRSTCRPIPS